MENEGLYNNTKNTDTLRLCFYTLVIVLGASKRGSGYFFLTKGSSKINMVFGVRSIRVFHNFRWMPIMNHYRGS